MDGSLVWKNQHHQSGTLMPLGAVHPIIASASEAIHRSASPDRRWIASSLSLLAMTAERSCAPSSSLRAQAKQSMVQRTGGLLCRHSGMVRRTRPQILRIGESRESGFALARDAE